VIEVSPYRWEPPQDEEPVVRLIEDLAAGWIDVLAATSAAQIDQLFGIAHQRGHEQLLRASLARPGFRVAAQGVVCASALQRRGVRVDMVPPRASMGALIVEIANRLDASTPRTPAPSHDETVAIFTARSVERAAIEGVLTALGPTAHVAVLDGKSRPGDRLVERLCVERGMAIERVRPSRTTDHPADEIVRRATRVILIAGATRDLEVGRVLRLAERYAKPVQVVRTDPSVSG
jgi:hypothetical protein